MLNEYDDPIEKQIDDSSSVYTGNVNQTIRWIYEQCDSAAFEKTHFTMNYVSINSSTLPIAAASLSFQEKTKRDG